MSEIRNGQHWRHVKRGGIYEIVHTCASVQVSSLDNGELEAMLEGEDWVAYRPLDNDNLYFRMKGEFLDGRFTLVKEAD